MNLLLLEPEEVPRHGLPGDDPRAAHLRAVLRAAAGDTVCVGVVNGPRGKATISRADDTGVAWTVAWEEQVQAPLPLHLLVGLPRPQTARKILHDAASLGFASIHFFQTEKGDPAYAQSSLWRDGEAAQLLRKGAVQAFSTLVPTLALHDSLEKSIGAVSQTTPPNCALVFLDIYEAPVPLGRAVAGRRGAVLAVGPERGWSTAERDLLRARGFTGAHLGDRVLRVETACVAAGAVALSAVDAWRRHPESPSPR